MLSKLWDRYYHVLIFLGDMERDTPGGIEIKPALPLVILGGAGLTRFAVTVKIYIGIDSGVYPPYLMGEANAHTAHILYRIRYGYRGVR